MLLSHSAISRSSLDDACTSDEIQALSRRRDNGRTVVKKGHVLDNRWVVPHNLYLAARYNCHINVELCISVSSVKYLYKYVYKGSDHASIEIEVNPTCCPGMLRTTGA